MKKNKKIIYISIICILLVIVGFFISRSPKNSSLNLSEKIIAISLNEGPYNGDEAKKTVILKEKEDIEQFIKAIDSIKYDKVEDLKESIYGPKYSGEIQYDDSQKNILISYSPSHKQIIIGDQVYTLSESMEDIFSNYLK